MLSIILNFYSLLKQNIKSCYAKRRRQRERRKNDNRSKKTNKQTKKLCTCSTLFLYISLPLFWTTTTWNFQKLSSYTFYVGNVVPVVVHFFSLAHFHLGGREDFSFSPLKKFHVVLPTNSCLSSALALCRSFSRWASLACRPLYFFSIFQICGHDNWSKLNTLDNKDTETISAFRFRLYWLFSCLCFTRRGWLCDFPPK